MELDEASMAVGRLERALSRIEHVLVERSSQPVEEAGVNGIPPARHEALRGEVTAVIAQLDAMIAAASRG
jgi:hypothetical protein